MSNLKDFAPAIVVYWTESEAGWGPRPDGLTVFTCREDAVAAIKKHWDGEKEKNPSGATPSLYWRPGDPQLCVVRKDVFETIDSSGKYTSKNSPDWLVTHA